MQLLQQLPRGRRSGQKVQLRRNRFLTIVAIAVVVILGVIWQVTASRTFAMPAGSVAPVLTLDSINLTSKPTLHWTAVDGAASYNVYLNGSLIGNTTDLMFVDNNAPTFTQITANGQDVYYVAALDATGEGPASNTGVITNDTRPRDITWASFAPSAVPQGVDAGSCLTLEAPVDTNPDTVRRLPSFGEFYDPVTNVWSPMSAKNFLFLTCLSFPGAQYPVGIYQFKVRTRNSLGQTSPEVTTPIDVFNAQKRSVLGQGTIQPNGASSSPGDVLPVVGGTAPVGTFNLSLQYDKTAPTEPIGHSQFTYGANCAQANSDCLLVDASRMYRLTISPNGGDAQYLAISTVTLGGQVQGTEYLTKVTLHKGKPTKTADRYMIQVYPVGQDDSGAPLYQASGDLSSGKLTVRR